ncbi:hypothetical protein EI165_18980 [Pseudoalteromonas nigrifaciens]|uniref:hypothetical protein n=1 Tax=Pseudoalteromonas nigrifaciens TaxID=28109 RepID=UPI0017885002|nr:hypothetical protein [Pseudoalteromonas nigrifaciens]MBE0422148.1 hypothetical protein [Pseudoalteromonas nigrifaciens]
MKIGSKYRAIKAAHSFYDLEGKKVVFEEERIEFKVLQKPEKVIVCDGDVEAIEPLPEHLRGNLWYCVFNFKAGLTHWFNSENYQITEL